MLDIIGAGVAGALITALAAGLIGLSAAPIAHKLAAFAATFAWTAIVASAAALGAFAPGTLGPVPAVLLPFSGLTIFLIGAWITVPAFRVALAGVPLPVMVGLQAERIAGVFFLLLYAAGRLSAPFAPVAGLGDIAVGTVAIPLAVMLTIGANARPAWAGLWNLFGALDLVVAVSLGLLSAPGTPFRIFTEGPGTLAMTSLPWVFVPAFLVPVFLLVHLAIAARLQTATQSDRPALA